MRGLTITKSDKEYREAIQRREERMSKMIARYGSLPGTESTRPNSYSDKGPEMDEAALIGDPESIILRLKTLQKMGFEYINILLPDDPYSLKLFAKEVMPEFKNDGAPLQEDRQTAVA